MSYLPKANPGHPVTYTADQQNAIADAVNPQFGRMSTPREIPPQANYQVVSGYNASENAQSIYAAGTPVELCEYYPATDIFKLQPVGENSTGYWGVLQDPLGPGKSGLVLLSGVTTVVLTETVEVGTKVMPDIENPGKFCSGGSRALVLAVNDENEDGEISAVILLSTATGEAGTLAVITQNPNGYGAAVAKKITINPDGSYLVDAAEIQIVVPKI